mgnify:CR=1 FL=1|jgi:multidrug resistance protein
MGPKQKKTVLLVVITAIFADMLTYGLIVPFLPIHAKSLGATQSEIGLLFASYSIALFIGTPIFGALADRVGRKKLLVSGLSILTATTIVYSLSTSFWMLIIARSLQGLAAAIPWTAGLALLAEAFPVTEQGKAMGIALSGQAAGILLGPPMGGWLFEAGGYSCPFFTAGAIALLSTFLCAMLLQKITEKKAKSVISPFKILRHRQILIISGSAVIGAATFASIEPTLPIHLNADLNLSPGIIGSMFVIMTLAYGTTSPIIGAVSIRLGPIKTIMIGIVMAAIMLPLNALTLTVWSQVIFLALLGISLGMILTPSLPKLAEISRNLGGMSQGLTFAVYNTAYSLGMMLGPLIAGSLAEGYGLIVAYAAIGAAFLFYLYPLYKMTK